MTDNNFSTLIHDESVGLSYITDFATKQRLWKHPNCEVCGIATYSFSTEPQSCGHHASERRERNDNEEMVA